MERFSTQKVILASIFLLALVVATAFFQIKLHFDTMIFSTSSAYIDIDNRVT